LKVDRIRKKKQTHFAEIDKTKNKVDIISLCMFVEGVLPAE